MNIHEAEGLIKQSNTALHINKSTSILAPIQPLLFVSENVSFYL